jgi:hypothetical protein
MEASFVLEIKVCPSGLAPLIIFAGYEFLSTWRLGGRLELFCTDEAMSRRGLQDLLRMFCRFVFCGNDQCLEL